MPIKVQHQHTILACIHIDFIKLNMLFFFVNEKEAHNATKSQHQQRSSLSNYVPEQTMGTGLSSNWLIITGKKIFLLTYEGIRRKRSLPDIENSRNIVRYAGLWTFIIRWPQYENFIFIKCFIEYSILWIIHLFRQKRYRQCKDCDVLIRF